MGRPPKPLKLKTFSGQVAARVRELRAKRKLSVPEAAAAAGVPPSTWYRWENAAEIRLDALPAIAKALGTTPRQLLPA